jgi:hypothetical protein
MKTGMIKLGLCLFLAGLIPLSCKKTVVGPTVTDNDIELFDSFVQLSNDAGDPTGTFKWGGKILNRSRFTVLAAAKLELINPDDVVFFTTSERLVEVTQSAQGTFEIKESGLQVPLPVFSSIKDWNMTIRLVSFK